MWVIRAAVKYLVRRYLVLFAFSAASTSVVTAAILLLMLLMLLLSSGVAASTTACLWCCCVCWASSDAASPAARCFVFLPTLLQNIYMRKNVHDIWYPYSKILRMFQFVVVVVLLLLFVFVSARVVVRVVLLFHLKRHGALSRARDATHRHQYCCYWRWDCCRSKLRLHGHS